MQKRMRTMVLLIGLTLTSSLAPLPSSPGRSFGPPVAAAQAEAAGAGDAVADAATRRAYRHVFLAFAVAWGLMVVYVVLLDRRYAALEQALVEGEEVGR